MLTEVHFGCKFMDYVVFLSFLGTSSRFYRAVCTDYLSIYSSPMAPIGSHREGGRSRELGNLIPSIRGPKNGRVKVQRVFPKNR